MSKYTSEDINNTIKAINADRTLLDMLLEVDGLLEHLGLYAFKNWKKGKIVEVGRPSKYWIDLTLMYDKADMPDPEGAKRLIARDCLVEYKKDTLIKPVRVKTYDDVQVDIAPDGRSRYKAKTSSEPCWVVSIDMPRKYVDEFSSENVEVEEDQYVNMDDIGKENELPVQNAQQDLGGLGMPMPLTPLPGETI